MSAAAKPISPRLRPMRIDDVASVVDIERASYQYPWTHGVFRDCIRVGYLCTVLEFDGQIGGYCIMSFGAGEAHVLNLCIAQSIRGQGFGRASMSYMTEMARHKGARKVILEVRPTNTSALKLYRSLGFQQIGTRKNYYQSQAGREDAMVFELTLSPVPKKHL
ncbi:MAG: ribosomal protein S18-alanine N-acetyltransferase [Pseudomonadota bacterium]